MLTFLLLPFGGYVLARAGVVPEGAPAVLGMLSGVVGTFLLIALDEERAPCRHARSRLTARTLTGERSLDLTRITTVWLLTTFSYARLVPDLDSARQPRGAPGSHHAEKRARRYAERSRGPTRTPRKVLSVRV